MNRSPLLPIFLWLAVVPVLLLMPGCAEKKASRFYEDPDPIRAPSATPPVQSAIDAPDAQPFRVVDGKTGLEGEEPETAASGPDDKPDGDAAGETDTTDEEATGSAREGSSGDSSGAGEKPAEKPKKPAGRLKPITQPEPVSLPEGSGAPSAEIAPKRALPKNSTVVTPGEETPTSQPGRLPVKQNLDGSQPKPSGQAKPKTIQPAQEPQQVPAKKQPERIIAPVDLAPMNPPLSPSNDDLPPPPKEPGQAG